MEQHKPPNRPHLNYWRQTKRLTSTLLVVWLVMTFGILFFARELTSIRFFGWTLSFYMAAQGLTIMYVILLGIFSLCSRRIEERDSRYNKDSH